MKKAAAEIRNNYVLHEALLKDILVRLHNEFEGLRLFRREVGLFMKPRTGRHIKIGLAGQSDLYGFYKGQHIEIEIKTGSGRLSKAQQNWRDLCLTCGVKWCLARSVDDALNLIKEIEDEKSD